MPVHLGRGVVILLCRRHASAQFIDAAAGRHFLLSIHMALKSAGALTPRASKALDEFVAARRRRAAAPPPARRRPGSYAWPELRSRLEDVLKRKHLSTRAMLEFVGDRLRVELRRGLVRPPSARTLRRWRAERRWDEPLATPG